jgi:outer membrane protein W
MMQNLNRKNSFEDYGAEPSPLVWEKIEKRLPVPSGKKRGWLIWSVAAILVTGIFLSIYVLDIEISLKKKGTAEKSVASSSMNETKSNTEKSSPPKNQLLVTENAKKNNDVAEKEKSSSENIVLLGGGKKTKLSKHTAPPAEQAITSSASNVEKATEENTTIHSEETVIALNESSTEEKEFIKNIPPIDIAMIPMPGDSTLTLKELTIDFKPLKKISASRWLWSVAGGENYNYRVLNFPSGNQSLTEGDKNYLSENEKGIQTFAFETGIGYHLSTHFSLNTGINYFTAGQERNRSEVTFADGVVGTPTAVYSVSTSAGTVSANGQQIDYAYFNGSDTSLFTAALNFSAANPSPTDSSTVQYFTLRQEFSFISLPLLIQYQTAEHRFTPYVGAGVSAGYIVQERVTVNDKELDNYRQSTNDIIFFAEAQAGVKYRINHKMFLKLQPSLRYGLNSLNHDDSVKWIPYSAGIGAGINFRF